MNYCSGSGVSLTPLPILPCLNPCRSLLYPATLPHQYGLLNVNALHPILSITCTLPAAGCPKSKTEPQGPTQGWAFFFSVASRPQRPYGQLGTGSPGRPPRLSHSPRVLTADVFEFSVALRLQRPYGLFGTGSHRTSTSTFTQITQFV